MKIVTHLALVATMLSLHSQVHARPQTESTNTPTTPPADSVESAVSAKSDIDFVVAGGYANFFSTDFDSGEGDVGVARGFLSASASGMSGDDLSWSLDYQAESSSYSFGPSGTLVSAAGGTPWGDVTSQLLVPGVTFVLDPRWRLTTRLLLQFAQESGASFGDSITYGGIVAASYSFSETLTLGLGALAMTRLEDDLLVVPQFIIDWQPSSDFRVSNFAGPEAFPGGAGLEGIWNLGSIDDHAFELALGGRYSSRRFLLDESGSSARANGIATDEGLPIWIRATVRGKCGGRLDLVAGMQIMGQMELDDAAGNELASVDVEPAPFVGIFMAFRF